MKDIMRKLVYSLEQLSLQHMDDKQSEVKRLPDNPMFPTLLNPSGAQTNMSNKKVDQSMEVMMMKRMNYIRNNLDLSNPREITSKIRQDAKQKRDERILELWKKDQEYPNIGDLIQNLKSEKQKVQKTDFIEVQNQLDVSLDSMQLTEPNNAFQQSSPHNQI